MHLKVGVSTALVNPLICSDEAAGVLSDYTGEVQRSSHKASLGPEVEVISRKAAFSRVVKYLNIGYVRLMVVF